MTNWLVNNNAHFHVADVQGKSFLICLTRVGYARLRFVEDIETGVRKVPTEEQKKSVTDIDDLIGMVISSF